MEHPLSQTAKDALKEVMNIGASHATTSLSKLVSRTVEITAPRLEVLSAKEIPAFVGKSDGVMSTVILKVTGDAPGVMMLMFSHESASQIANVLVKENGGASDEALRRSALEEVGNILVGSCLTSLGKFLHMNFVQSVPNFATDMVGSLLDTVITDFEMHAEHVLAAEVHFLVPELSAEGGIFFLFDPSSTKKILQATDALLA